MPGVQKEGAARTLPLKCACVAHELGSKTSSIKGGHIDPTGAFFLAHGCSKVKPSLKKKRFFLALYYLQDKDVIKQGQKQNTISGLGETFPGDVTRLIKVNVIRENNPVNGVEEKEVKSPFIYDRIVEYFRGDIVCWLVTQFLIQKF